MVLGKVRVNITVEQSIVQKAKELGLNISKTCENALKEAIRRLEAPNPSNTSENFSVNAFIKRVGGSPEAIRTLIMRLSN